MADKQIAYTRRRRIKGAKMEDKSQIQSKNTNENKKTNSNNGTENDDEPDLLHVVVPNSSSDSQNNGEDELAQVEDSYEDDDNGDDEEAKSNEIANQRRNNAKNGDDEGEKEDSTRIKSTNETPPAASHCFSMHRISRIIKSEDPDIRIAQESVFLVNKASEKFLELFCKEAYGCAFLDYKKHVEYKHLFSVVSKRRRFDFLSDFVPEKAKAKDALSELSSAET